MTFKGVLPHFTLSKTNQIDYVPMNITEFSNLRKNWYDTIQVNVDNDIYFGNIVSADWSEGICKYKLIGRIL